MLFTVGLYILQDATIKTLWRYINLFLLTFTLFLLYFIQLVYLNLMKDQVMFILLIHSYGGPHNWQVICQ
jgi:hypothetical protein